MTNYAISTPMETLICTSCRKPKGILTCEICSHPFCKKCVQILHADSFSFLDLIPEVLKHETYCGNCYDENVASPLADYQQTMDLAKSVFIFFKSKGETTRLMNRSQKPVRVADCTDRDETILRLAFFAARANFNALVSVEITAKQVRNAGWQTSRWQGIGIPTRVDAKKWESDDRAR